METKRTTGVHVDVPKYLGGGKALVLNEFKELCPRCNQKMVKHLKTDFVKITRDPQVRFYIAACKTCKDTWYQMDD